MFDGVEQRDGPTGAAIQCHSGQSSQYLCRYQFAFRMFGNGVMEVSPSDVADTRHLDCTANKDRVGGSVRTLTTDWKC